MTRAAAKRRGKKKAARKKTLRKRLEGIVSEMVDGGIRLDEAVEQFESIFLRRVLEQSDGNQTRAAERLGMHRNTLRKKLQRLG